MKKTKFLLTLDEDLKKMLEEKSDELDLSMSQLLRSILKQYFSDSKSVTKTKK